MSQYLKPILILLACASLLFLPPALAGEGKPQHKNAAGHHDSKAKHKGHHFSPHWSKTLSDEQRLDIDRLHLELGRELAVLKAKEVLKEKELNVLSASGKAGQKAIYAKIDELMEVKRDIMRQRHDHLVEMRELLTPEQRLSYDMEILGRSGVK